MQSHLGSVVRWLASIAWLGLKFLDLLRDLWWKCTTSAECKTNRLAVLTVTSGLDPHMINLWKSMTNLMHLSLFMLFISYVNCGFGINLHLLVTMLLIKLDQLKCWMLKPISLPQNSLACCILFPLAEYGMCSRLFSLLQQHYPDVVQTWRDLKISLETSTNSRRACHQSAACGVDPIRCVATR